MILFNEATLKPYKKEVWTTIIVIIYELANKLRSITLYISVYQDRHNYQTKFKKSLNIFTNDSNIINDSECSENKTSSDKGNNESDIREYEKILIYLFHMINILNLKNNRFL